VSVSPLLPPVNNPLHVTREVRWASLIAGKHTGALAYALCTVAITRPPVQGKLSAPYAD